MRMRPTASRARVFGSISPAPAMAATSLGGCVFHGWPSYMIDVPGAANRVMQWLAWKFQHRRRALLQHERSVRPGNDPWTNVSTFREETATGPCSTRDVRAESAATRDIPIESIRLKLIREGMEDYEYLALLAKLDGTAVRRIDSRTES